MNYRMIASSLYHLAKYSIQKPKNRLEKAALIFSIDVDVGDKQLSTLNKGKNDANVNYRMTEYQVGEIEELALPLFINTFDKYQVPATFAIRGQLAEVDFKLNSTFGSKTIHEIASHGYYHKPFGSLTLVEAEKELNLTSQGMKKLGLKPTSFIYPRNEIKYLDLLPKYGYKTYRSRGGRKLDAMFIEQNGDLFDVHPSLYIDNTVKAYFFKKILDVAIKKKAPLHIWFHLWNFGYKKSEINRYLETTFVCFLKNARKKADAGVLALETMGSAPHMINTQQN